MRLYRVKVTDKSQAKPDQVNEEGYLAQDGVIIEYSLSQAIRKAYIFNGVKEYVRTELPPEPVKPKVLILVRGGMIQSIIANTEIEVSVADYDNIAEDDEGDIWQYEKDSVSVVPDAEIDSRIEEINQEEKLKKEQHENITD